MRIRRAARKGLSLLEVLASMAIFLIAVVGLMELVNYASRQALEISQVNQANQFLEDRLNAVTGGIIPLQGGGQSDTPFDDDPDWSWSMDTQGENTPNLYRVTIRVKWQKGNDSEQWSVSRMVFDPAQKGTLEAPPSSSSTGTTGGK